MEHLKTDRLSQACEVHRVRMMEFFLRASQAGIQLMLVRCYSSLQEQLEIYKIGRNYNVDTNVWTETGPVRTNALPGQTAHNVVDSVMNTPASCASDIIPVDSKGNPMWSTSMTVWNKLYEICNKKCGLDAYGDPWGRYMGNDLGHLEEPMWQLILPAMNLKKPSVNLSTLV